MNEKAVAAMHQFLEALGLDLSRAGMEKTPERVAQMYEMLFDGCAVETKDLWEEVFDSGMETGGMVAVRHIPFYSMCEHHLVPFFGEVNLVYLPSSFGIAGFGKFTRLVEILSHRPQLQERLTRQVAEEIESGLQADGVLVVVEAQQLCMMMRGDLGHGTRTVTSCAAGKFREDERLRQQAWELLGRKEA